MERTNLVEIVNGVINTLNLDGVGHISNNFRALASGDASEVQSLCFQLREDIVSTEEEEAENIKASMLNYIVNEVEKSVGQRLIKNELGNGCIVYTIDNAGMSLNIYDTDYGFWATLVYNLD